MDQTKRQATNVMQQGYDEKEAALKARVEAAEAEVKRLRSVLQPMADVAGDISETWPDDAQVVKEIGHFRRARTALEAAPSAASPVASIVPDHCSGSVFVFEGGCLHVRKDGSGYIVVDEDDFALEDDRCEGEHGPEGSVHWIARFPAGEMTSLRDFLNGQGFSALSAQVQDVAVAEIVSKHGDPEAFGERELVALVDIQKYPYGTKLYAAARAKREG